MKTLTKLSAIGVCAALWACAGQSGPQLTKSGLDPANFVTEVDGKPVALYTLTNSNGMEVCITNFGGRIVSLMAPTRTGEWVDVVLGFDSISPYQTNPTDFGASIGRYANRIDHGRLPLPDSTYNLPPNNVEDENGNLLHSLHGGPRGWQYQVYAAQQPNDSTLVLTMDSPDGDNGFPGHVVAQVTYTLTSDNTIDISYEATTDKTTVMNMTHHSYFNLSGDPAKNVLGQTLTVNADSITPVDAYLIPDGTMLAVEGTPFDFRKPHLIGDSIASKHQQMIYANGYDHNWVLATGGDIEKPAAELFDPSTGIVLTVYTDEPGIQVYTGNFLDGSLQGKKGKTYQQRSAICLESQHYPDSPNKPQFPSVRLNPGETYRSHCIYKFDTK